MNIIEQGRRFVQWLRELAGRSAKDWRVCLHCGSTVTCKNGTYMRHPWSLVGKLEVRVQRHKCRECGRSYSEESALLERGSWYVWERHRFAIEHW